MKIYRLVIRLSIVILRTSQIQHGSSFDPVDEWGLEECNNKFKIRLLLLQKLLLKLI